MAALAKRKRTEIQTVVEKNTIQKEKIEQH
jgi:hypothetical protein